MKTVESYLQQLIDAAVLYAPRLLLALIFLIAGLWLVKKAGKGLRKMMHKRKMDTSLVPFISGILTAILYAMLLISVASMIGIATTSFIALIGAAGLAVGLALQGSLSNFAGGVMILTMRPFKVGDVIEAQGVIASVTEIQIFHTVLKSYDNKTIIIPNGPLYNDKIINYSTEPTRKVEWVFGIGYQDDIDKAKNIIKEVIFTDERVLDADSPFINVSELADSSVNLKVRAQVNQPDYWGLFFEKTEAVKKAFDAQGITIPFPQRDVHHYNP